jgi:hypothetical protein
MLIQAAIQRHSVCNLDPKTLAELCVMGNLQGVNYDKLKKKVQYPFSHVQSKFLSSTHVTAEHKFVNKRRSTIPSDPVDGHEQLLLLFVGHSHLLFVHCLLSLQLAAAMYFF